MKQERNLSLESYEAQSSGAKRQNRRLDAIIKIHVIAPAALKVFKEIIVIIDILL
jgi:hypothetical protein